ncbi:MAG: phosphoribosyltransferase [Smithella sp.]|nr:phosphoribosyltransferase [Syntrophaceae bacterium]NTW77345.1 phosphoribosyltransferase [Syntrophaceae bacterium]
MTLPAKEKFRCDMLSWGSIIRDSQNLAWMVRNSGYAPNIIVAIGRGGYVPARILCDYLLIPDLASIKVEHWGSSVVKGEAFIKFALRADIRNKKVLLVDDVTDTGDTLKVSLQYLKRFHPLEIRTAILVHKTRSTIVPDYFVKKIVKWRWIIFPWHRMEDLSEFIKKLKAEGICSENDLKTSLKQRYDMDIPIDTIREVLSIIG